MRIRGSAGKAVMATALGGVIGAALAVTAVQSQTNRLELKVVSSRPDLVSGGDTLVSVKGGDLASLSFTVNGQPATVVSRRPGRNGEAEVLVAGLRNGANTIEARAGSASARVGVTNHGKNGPILSGPHMKPYECRTQESGLGNALDEDCNAPTRLDWFYRTKGGEFKPLAPGARPADLATATTIEGKTVPYIVRVESGTLNRTIYRIAVLDDPGANPVSGVVERLPANWQPAAWNGRFSVSFGGGAGTKYNQGINQVTAPLSDLYLSRGFAHMVATELVNGLHGNQVLQGESLMMIKEHMVERYGTPRWTVGTGGSGGAIQQLVITQIFPGLLDGLQPSLSFPDSSMFTPDCGLLQNYWKTKAGANWTQEKKTAVEGLTPGTCGAWERSFVPVSMANYKPGCDLKDQSLIYDAKTNRKGARCAVQEMRANVYGRDPATGFAYKTGDNIGVQYGLKGLNDGKISVDEFLELNEKIGGNDIDGSFVAARSVGDLAAIRANYASGMMNSGGGGLANVPILMYRNYTDSIGDIHDRHRDLTIRARMQTALGRTDHTAVWVGPGRPAAPAGGRGAAAENQWKGPQMADQALDAMTKWLDALTADPAPLSIAKVVKHKPAEATDAYFDNTGRKLLQTATWDNNTPFNKMYPVNLEPRMVSGAPQTNDVMKCQLKPVNVADYKVSFTPAQQQRLKSVFRTGVCDYSKKPMGWVALKGYYQRY